jgi:hypothetical protein
VQVKQITCKYGAPTQDGSKYSSLKRVNSLTGPTTRFLMSPNPRMKKVKQLELLETLVRTTRNGEFLILTKQLQSKLKVLTKNLDSILIDHSTSDQDFQCKELPNATELTTFG